MEEHRKAVTRIAAAVRVFHDGGRPFRVFHGSTNTTRPQAHDHVVDISALSHVLVVDAATRTALVEPNVPMDLLVSQTLQHGLVPPVVMEFPGITAGGGFAGTAGESSSFKHGFFDDTIAAVEMVLANGEVVRAESTGERADLFHGAAGALGTLGLTTLLELQLIPAKTFVQVTYIRKSSVAETVAEVRQQASRHASNDYVDGILFSREHGVVVTGRLTDDKPAAVKPQTFSRARDPWFYIHARRRTLRATASEPPVDYIPLAEYLFRYDRAGFWVGAEAFNYFGLGRNRLTFNRVSRWLLDDLLHTRMLYRALHASGESARFVAQDLALPYENAEAFVDFTARHFAIWPLWLCPLRQRLPPTFHPHTGQVKDPARDPEEEGSDVTEPSKMPPESRPAPMLNIGLWGWGPSDPDEFVAKNRLLETELRSLNGMKWLYAHTYYPEAEFWQLYDKANYDSLRVKYGASNLPTVYEKAKVDPDKRKAERETVRGRLRARWPVPGLIGVMKGVRSGDWRLHRAAEWKSMAPHPMKPKDHEVTTL